MTQMHPHAAMDRLPGFNICVDGHAYDTTIVMIIAQREGVIVFGSLRHPLMLSDVMDLRRSTADHATQLSQITPQFSVDHRRSTRDTYPVFYG